MIYNDIYTYINDSMPVKVGESCGSFFFWHTNLHRWNVSRLLPSPWWHRSDMLHPKDMAQFWKDVIGSRRFGFLMVLVYPKNHIISTLPTVFQQFLTTAIYRLHRHHTSVYIRIPWSQDNCPATSSDQLTLRGPSRVAGCVRTILSGG